MGISDSTSAFVRKARTNFYYAFLFLPKPKRDAIFATYAFSRFTDDLVDDASSPEAARENLRTWRSQLEACYEGRAEHPIAIDLQKTLFQFPIPKSHFLNLIEGVEMDLHNRRYATFDDLYQYCYRVASTIGLICIEIFGYRNLKTRDYAVNLGVALQLTNIMRDLKTDAQQDRIYIPSEDLKRFGYSEPQLLSQTYNPAFVKLMHFQANRAKEYYARARKFLTDEDRPDLFSAEIMGHIYAALLRRIESVHYNVFENTVALSSLKKFSIALSTWVRAGTQRSST